MATAEQTSPLKSSKKLGTSRSRNDSDSQWLLLPNNLELGARAKPSKKQRNKEKHRNFPKENLSSSSEVADGLSCKTRSFQNFPRVKSNTASWLKEHCSNDDKRELYDSEEICSDSDVPHHLPAKQPFPVVEYTQEHQMTTTRSVMDHEKKKPLTDEIKRKETTTMCDILSHIQEFISEAESSWQKLDLSDEPVIKDAFVKLKNAVKDAEGDIENKGSLQRTASENGFANGVSPSSSSSSSASNPKDVISRASNSKEEFMVTEDNERHFCEEELDKCNHRQGRHFIIASEEQNERHFCEEDLDKCNRRQGRHFIIANEEQPEYVGSDDCDISQVGKKVSTVEWECKKLNNKLVKLQKEKKKKDELLKELYFLKNVANSASSDAQFEKAKEEQRKKLGKLHSPSQQHSKKIRKATPPVCNQNIGFEPDASVSQLPSRKHGKLQSPSQQHSKEIRKVAPPVCNQNIGSESPDTSVSQLPSRQSQSSGLRLYSVRRQSNSAFPARRHYEAEGRANEDPDIPPAPVPPLSPALENSDFQDKIRKLKIAQQHVKKIDQYLSFEESDGESNGEEEYPSLTHIENSDAAATNVKEACGENAKTTLLDIESHKCEATEQATVGNRMPGTKELAKLQRFLRRCKYASKVSEVYSDQKNDDPVRSSGEGAYTQKKNPSRNVGPENMQNLSSLRPVQHQDNLQLIRQNIVPVESQNQSSNSNFSNRDCNSVKKDNINNLSGKMGKLSIQNSMNSSYPDVLAGSNNIDSMSTFSYELNQNQSLPNEIERKTIIDILKHDKKKQKQYDTNQDSRICCNSSVDSEPLEGSASALPVDTSADAPWQGTLEEFLGQVENFQEQEVNEENVPVFDKESLTGHRSTSQYSGRFSNMQHYMDSARNVPVKQQRNVHRSLFNVGPNQPSAHGGYQQPAQVIKPTHRQISTSNTGPGLTEDTPEACTSDSADHCNQQSSSKFIQQLKSHIDQLNSLCQTQVFQNRSQSSASCHHTQSYSNLTNTCAPLQPTPEFPMLCNQQLLLYLSSVTIQCYHALYMQQLEIQQLQRCAFHNVDTENIQPSNFSSRNNPEDLGFRPYCMQSDSNTFIPSNYFPPDQVSSLSTAPYFHLPIKPYSSLNNETFASASATQPARAVIHPTSQNNVTAQETLNNQVPPRTRANNFWDNFRSYSRQNLLSTANYSKQNENISSPITPQVRHVHPLVLNESPNRVSDSSNTCCSAFPEYNRPAQNQDMQEGGIFSKKTKTKTVVATGTNDSKSFEGTQKKDLPTNANSPFRNPRNRYSTGHIESSLVQPVSASSSNLIQLNTVQDNSKVGTFSSTHPIFGTQAASDSITPHGALEGPKASEDHQYVFLVSLIHEARSLKSEALREKALKIVKDFVMNERKDDIESSQLNKFQNDQTLPTNRAEASAILNPSCKKKPEAYILIPEILDDEKSASQIPSDAPSGNIQSLPTAAIPPLSKHCTPGNVSTGAIRKKTKNPSIYHTDSISTGARKKTKGLGIYHPDSVLNGPTSANDSGGSTADSVDVPPVLTTAKIKEDLPGLVTGKVLSDLVSMLPSLKRRLARDGYSQSFQTFVNDWLIENLRMHFLCYNINLSLKSLLHLRQTVCLFLSLFTSTTLSDFDSDFLKYLEQFIYANIACFVASGQFAPVPSSLDEENFSLEMDDKIQDLSVKMHTMPGVEMKELSIKMPTEEIDTFSSHYRLAQQNLLQSNFIYDKYVPLPVARPDWLGTSEDGGCHCNPEAEIELDIETDVPEVETDVPEVETDEPEVETEADLAEADQSPGQQGTMTDGLSSGENSSPDHETVLLSRNANIPGALSVNTAEIRDGEDSSEGATGTQCFPGTCLDAETILDDIPTKLCPSEEEFPQQLKEDQPVQLLLDEVNTNSDFASENIGDGGLINHR